MIGPSSNEFISIGTAQRAAMLRETIRERYEQEETSESAKTTLHAILNRRALAGEETISAENEIALPIKAASKLSFAQIRELQSQPHWYEADRFSLHSKVLLQKEAITLSTDIDEAVAQIAGFFEEQDASPPHLKLHSLITHGKDSDYLLTILKVYYSSLSPEKTEVFLNELAELSFYSKTLPFVSACATFIQETILLAEKIYEGQASRKLTQTVHQFIFDELGHQKADETLFRTDTLATILSGIAVRKALKRQLDGLCLKFKSGNMRSTVNSLDKVISQLFTILARSKSLIALVQQTRVEPIRTYFKDKDPKVIEKCVRRGVIDMVFLRGLCPLITNLDSLDSTKKILLSKFIIIFVNDQEYSNKEYEQLNILITNLKPQLEECLRIYTGKYEE